MAISAKDVKELRERTGAGMMDCKKALTANDGDMQKAIDWLREKGIAKAAKKSGRVAAEGAVAAFVSKDGKTGVLLEVNCETDFTANNENFRALEQKVIEYIAEAKPADLDALNDGVIGGKRFGSCKSDDIIDGKRFGSYKLGDIVGGKEFGKYRCDDIIGGKKVSELVTEATATIGEKISIRRFVTYETKGKLTTYIHMGGKIGVLVDMTGGTDELGKDVAMQIAAANPLAVDRAGVDASELEHEKEILRKQALEEGKPEKIVEKMVMGRINKFYKEVCLVEQEFVKSDPNNKQTVKDILGGEKVLRFARYQLGEGIEKKETDFAAEVAAQAGM
ncbi:MAG: translation elongation factor Ts [Selenomonadaceae bacterium]|nr:translation elongation factor Ts [Selenomonadaceae bacterium]